MGWDCDCYESMHARCQQAQSLLNMDDYTEAKCFRALFCMHDGVCESWKLHFCEGLDSLFNGLNASYADLTAPSLLLRSRQSHVSRGLLQTRQSHVSRGMETTVS